MNQAYIEPIIKCLSVTFLLVLPSIIITYIALNHFLDTIYKSVKLTINPPSVDELSSALNLVIGMEINSYENDLFDKRQIVDNATFENYYLDLCSRIMNGLSPTFINRMTYLMTEEEIGSLIARYVKNYLSQKFAIPNKDEEIEDE